MSEAIEAFLMFAAFVAAFLYYNKNREINKHTPHEP